MSPIESKSVVVEDRKIHYLIAGSGEPILFIHGFPTSSYLWRNVMAGLLPDYQVIAIDLPGYGQSEKRLEDSFSFRYYARILSGFLDELGLDKVTLGVHDVGGPVGLYWMVNNMDRVSRLILFNTLVFPKFSWAVKLFGLATVLPGVRSWISGPGGIKFAMKIGVYNDRLLSEEDFANYQQPFLEKKDRKVLLKSVQRLSLKGFKEVEEKLPNFKGPVQVIYGENDKILPRVGETMRKVQEILPQTKLHSIPDCGHFLQEDAPEQIAGVIAEFLKSSDS